MLQSIDPKLQILLLEVEDSKAEVTNLEALLKEAKAELHERQQVVSAWYKQRRAELEQRRIQRKAGAGKG